MVYGKARRLLMGLFIFGCVTILDVPIYAKNVDY